MSLPVKCLPASPGGRDPFSEDKRRARVLVVEVRRAICAQSFHKVQNTRAVSTQAYIIRNTEVRSGYEVLTGEWSQRDPALFVFDEQIHGTKCRHEYDRRPFFELQHLPELTKQH